MRHRFVIRKASRIDPVDKNPPRPRGRSEACKAIYARALVLWPRLDRGRLRRTYGDPLKVARLVARRTVLTEESILSLLLV